MNGRLPLPAGPVTVTVTAPAGPPGVTAVIWVALLTVKLVAAVPPKVTAVAPVKPEPVIVTDVPPVAGPLAGETESIVGGGTGSHQTRKVSVVDVGGSCR